MTGADSTARLMHKAGSLLARRAYSRSELQRKLIAHAEAPDVDAVLDRLEELNLLNDADYAYNAAIRWILQAGWGTIKVRHQLLRRGVSKPLAEEAIRRVRQDIDDHDALEKYLERKSGTGSSPGTRKEVRRLIQSLRRRGYPDEVIWTVLRKRVPAVVWQTFDTGE
jgi:regulatory protein